LRDWPLDGLARALAEFPGALLIVTHDARFAQALCTSSWTVENGVVR